MTLRKEIVLTKYLSKRLSQGESFGNATTVANTGFEKGEGRRETACMIKMIIERTGREMIIPKFK